MTRVLFVCGRNRLRSPTAEAIFASHPDVECASAGVNPDADEPVGTEAIDWAELIFTMEKSHKTKLASRFGAELKNKRVICLDIPDQYPFMDPSLVDLLRRKVTPFLPSRSGSPGARHE